MEQEKAKAPQTIATFFFEFLIERRVIGTIEEKTGQTTKVKGGGRAKKSPKYVEPLFSLKILPRTMNLPMILTPLPWEARSKKEITGENKDIIAKKRVPN